jgi:Thrombospondin type 3 repeat
MGDSCDSDIDNDGVPNNDDNCPFIPVRTVNFIQNFSSNQNVFFTLESRSS